MTTEVEKLIASVLSNLTPEQREAALVKTLLEQNAELAAVKQELAETKTELEEVDKSLRAAWRRSGEGRSRYTPRESHGCATLGRFETGEEDLDAHA